MKPRFWIVDTYGMPIMNGGYAREKDALNVIIAKRMIGYRVINIKNK